MFQEKIDTIFVDMDGVLTNFVEGACKAHNQPCPFTKDPHCFQNQGQYDLVEMWGMSVKDFWEPLRPSDFWFTLSKTKEADTLIHTLETIPNIEIYILTSPSLSPNSHYGKALWVEAHYPKYITKTIMTGHKHLFAKPNTLLIDDSDKIVDKFTAYNGQIILFPRYWNSNFEWAEDSWPFVKDQLQIKNLI